VQELKSNEAKLYGIKHSNRSSEEFWSKNKFNSSFPVSLACYMRDKKIKAVYLKLDENLKVVSDTISIDEVFNCGNTPNEALYFAFESKFDPYQVYSYESIRGIDLVVKDINGNFLRPLEVKLTVLPDNYTCLLAEEDWSSEIVIRPATTSYCALGIADSCKSQINRIREIFEPIGSRIESWTNSTEMYIKMNNIIDAIDFFEREFYTNQKPLILQPIWKTKGKSPYLDDNAFDIFVWSDFAFTRLFLDASRIDDSGRNINANISRPMRSCLRLARFLYDYSRSGKVRLTEIYRQMSFHYQSDKEFSVNGGVTSRYMKHPRLRKPILPKEAVYDIILNNGMEKLSPERRFDQTIYFTLGPK